MQIHQTNRKMGIDAASKPMYSVRFIQLCFSPPDGRCLDWSDRLSFCGAVIGVCGILAAEPLDPGDRSACHGDAVVATGWTCLIGF
jgi:hypothetical protein